MKNNLLLLTAAFLITLGNAHAVPEAWGNVFSCENPTKEEYMPFGTVFDKSEVFPFQGKELFLSVSTFFNSGEINASQKRRTHLSQVSILKMNENSFDARSSDGLYALSLDCKSRCGYAGSLWEGELTYATTWDKQAVQGLRKDTLVCRRVGFL